MGEHQVLGLADAKTRRQYQQQLLEDLDVLKQMLEEGRFVSGPTRVGAEQELFLVDQNRNPAPMALEVLKRAQDPRLTTEMAQFNLEANLTPRVLEPGALHALESELNDVLANLRPVAHELHADVVLAGILPTLQRAHMALDYMTPSPRYRALNDALLQERGEQFHLHIRGIDGLDLTHANVVPEAFCTSFQLHWQVAPDDFVAAYNWAQLITAPCLAAAANSPLLLGRRLWHETRIALFEQAVDARGSNLREREAPTRVLFGQHWLEESVVNLFRENVERFPVLVAPENAPLSSLQALQRGETPALSALTLHNGTVYRWNRPCYGVGPEGPHLRIEARALPAGPSVVDEVANAAFFFGLMAAGVAEHGNVAQHLPFVVAKHNFLTVAREGLHAHVEWLNNWEGPVADLIVGQLIPMALQGLQEKGVPHQEAAYYLNVLTERVTRRLTGSQWMLNVWESAPKDQPVASRQQELVRAMIACQHGRDPVAHWPIDTGHMDEGSTHRTVSHFMSTDLFTVRGDDLIDLAASVMRWRHVRHVPVEDSEGNFLGMVTSDRLWQAWAMGETQLVAVDQVMEPCPGTLSPQATLTEVLQQFKLLSCSALPVVEQGRLVGLVTERDLVRAAADHFAP